MNTEIEAKFLNVDFDEIRKKLAEIGAICEQPMRLMRRVIIEPPELAAKDAFLRVRDEGDKVTLTYKQFNDSTSVHGTKEVEVQVSDFDTTIALLQQVGLEHRSFQESRRETWKLDKGEVVLDEWPWLNPYIEIEGHSEEVVKDVAEQLGLNWEKAVFGQVTTAYKKQYPQMDEGNLVKITKIAFGDPVPEIISGQKLEEA